MMQEERVTILLATYNGEKYIAEQLDSIIGQTYKNWRIIVSDDGSADNTISIIKDYQSRFPDKIIILKDHERFGSACGNFLYLLEQAVVLDSDYIMFCDQDDVWLEDKIALTLSRMKEREEIASSQPFLVFTDLEVVDEKLRTISSSFMRYSKLKGNRTHLRHLLVQNVVTGCTVMVNKPLARLALQIKDQRNIIMHDWWLGLVCAAFGTIEYINVPTMKYRQHPKNEVGAKKVMSFGYLLNKLIVDNNINRSIEQSMRQAGQFYRSYHAQLEPDTADMIATFAELKNQCKIKRILFIFKHGLWKYGFLRKTAQLIYI